MSQAKESKKATAVTSRRAGPKMALATAPLQAEKIVKELGLGQPATLIIVAGGENLSQKAADRLQWHLGRGITGANLHEGTMVLDATTQSVTRHYLGDGIVSSEGAATLVGIAPRGAVFPGQPAATQAPDWAALGADRHFAFVLAPGEAPGDMNDTLFALTSALGKSIPVVLVVVGGDESTVPVVLNAVESGWPIVALQESGGLAEELATRATRQFLTPAEINLILTGGRLYPLSLSSSPTDLRRLLIREIERVNVLRQAWTHFARYDESAKQYQTEYRRLRKWILILGVASTLLVVLEKFLRLQLEMNLPDVIDQGLHWLIVGIPVVVSILLAATHRFHVGSKWVTFRSCAEHIKAEIYRFRVLAHHYTAAENMGASPEEVFILHVHELLTRAADSEAGISPVPSYSGPIPPPNSTQRVDNGLTLLSPRGYIRLRLDDQLGFYRSKTKRLQKTLTRNQWAIYVLGGLGTFLAAIGQDLFIVLTTALLTALTVYLENEQIETTLKKYHLAAEGLERVKDAWEALPAERKHVPETIKLLVDETEQALQTEHSGWVVQMQKSVSSLSPKRPEESPRIEAPRLEGVREENREPRVEQE
ncbi:MAG TPA: DUF4231 domain-containing protein [Ktedonobacterales bacterium]